MVDGTSLDAPAAPITSNLYPETQTRDLPEHALAASLGRANPTALLPLEAGCDPGCCG